MADLLLQQKEWYTKIFLLQNNAVVIFRVTIFVMKEHQIRIGEYSLLAYAALAAFFPIVAHYETRVMPPILFAGISTVVSGLGIFFYLLAKKIQSAQVTPIFSLNKKALPSIIINMFCSVVIPFFLFFIGASLTSAVNTVLLPHTEVVFALLICGLFCGEHITLRKGLSAALILLGVFFVLYTKNFTPHFGDLLIIASAFFFPIGNIFLKKALALAHPHTILFVRQTLGGVLLVLASVLFEDFSSFSLLHNLPLILFNGIVILGIARLFWFQGIKLLDVGTSTLISTAQPALGLLYAFAFLGVTPTVFQGAGFAIIVLGIFMLVKI